MTQDMAQRVEQELAVLLPSACKNYLSNFPFSPDGWMIMEGRFYTPAEIIKTTEFFREDGFFERQWPHRYLAIGGDGVGNEYFVNVEEANPAVYLAEHERSSDLYHVEIEYNQVAASLNEWVEKALEFENNLPEWAKEMHADSVEDD